MVGSCTRWKGEDLCEKTVEGERRGMNRKIRLEKSVEGGKKHDCGEDPYAAICWGQEWKGSGWSHREERA